MSTESAVLLVVALMTLIAHARQSYRRWHTVDWEIVADLEHALGYTHTTESLARCLTCAPRAAAAPSPTEPSNRLAAQQAPPVPRPHGPTPTG